MAPARPPRDAAGDLERSAEIGRGLTWLSTWSLRLLLIALAGVVVFQALGLLWVVVLPVVLALLLASVLWAPTAWLRRHRVPASLASLLVVLGSLAALVGLFAGLAPQVADQVGEIGRSAAGGLERVQDYVTGPPLELDARQIDNAVNQVTDRLRGSASAIASGVLNGVGAVGSGLVTFFLALVLTFFFLKDGPKFLPWLRLLVGERAGRHLDVVLTRSWAVLGSFIQGQAIVGLVDAVLIGIGLAVLGVPLALPLAVLTFFGGFVPIVGAFVVGALAVLVALVSNGTTAALVVLAIIVAVQQIEGNVLQPMLQGKSLSLHPAVVLLAVTAGGSLFGIAGAFFSVPIAAVAAVVVRYLGEIAEDRTGEPSPGPDPRVETPSAPSAEPGADEVETSGPAAPAGSGRVRPLRSLRPPRATAAPERAAPPTSARPPGRRRRRAPRAARPVTRAGPRAPARGRTRQAGRRPRARRRR